MVMLFGKRNILCSFQNHFLRDFCKHIRTDEHEFWLLCIWKTEKEIPIHTYGINPIYYVIFIFLRPFPEIFHIIIMTGVKPVYSGGWFRKCFHIRGNDHIG